MIEQIINEPLYGGAPLQTPTSIIVHAMAEYVIHNGKKLHAVEFLKIIGLSAHALVTPSGVIIRCRRDDQGAWHAKGHNTNTLGIEFLVPRIHDYASFADAIEHENYLTDAAYFAGVAQGKEWVRRHNIHAIERHSDVDPLRKIDPGAMFPWEAYKEAIQS